MAHYNKIIIIDTQILTWQIKNIYFKTCYNYLWRKSEVNWLFALTLFTSFYKFLKYLIHIQNNLNVYMTKKKFVSHKYSIRWLCIIKILSNIPFKELKLLIS